MYHRSEARVAGVVGMILAAGLGTRLRPLTDILPKPAVPVLGMALVRHALARLAAGGAVRAVMNAHHLAPVMERVAREAASAVGIPLAVSAEPVIAGTGGALREARRWLGGADAVVIWNGDVLFDLDVRAALRAHAAHAAAGARATMVLAPMPRDQAYAAVEVDGSGRVRRIAGHGPGGEGLAPLHFTGVHVVSPELLDAVPAEPFACDVNRHVYPPLLGAGGVAGWVADGYWNDLGTPERYLQANLDALSGRAPLSLPGADPLAGAERRGGVGGDVWICPGARVDGEAELAGPAWVGPGARVAARARIGPGTVVGAGVEVGAGAELERVVAWEGTAIAAGERLVDAVAAGSLRVPARPATAPPPPPAAR